MADVLPNGTTAASEQEYIDTWRQLAADVAVALGAFESGEIRILAYDPDLAFMVTHDNVTTRLDIDQRVARAIQLLVKRIEKLE